MFHAVIGQPTTVPFTSVGFATGLTTFTVITLLNGQALVPMPMMTFTEIGGGAYTLTFTPTQTGVYTFFIQQQLLNITVTTTSFEQSLQTLQDAALGS